MRGLRIFENHKSDAIFGISVKKRIRNRVWSVNQIEKVEKTVTLIFIALTLVPIVSHILSIPMAASKFIQ